MVLISQEQLPYPLKMMSKLQYPLYQYLNPLKKNLCVQVVFNSLVIQPVLRLIVLLLPIQVAVPNKHQQKDLQTQIGKLNFTLEPEDGSVSDIPPKLQQQESMLILTLIIMVNLLQCVLIIPSIIMLDKNLAQEVSKEKLETLIQ